MTSKLLAGQDVEVDPEGFLVDASQWNKDVASAIAKEEGIDDLTGQHMQVINFMRSEYMAKGTAPNIRLLGKTSGVTVKELYQLFPKGPAKLAAKIAGIPKPHGCI